MKADSVRPRVLAEGSFGAFVRDIENPEDSPADIIRMDPDGNSVTAPMEIRREV